MRFLTVILLTLSCSFAFSQTVEKIIIRGNKKITADAIKEKLTQKEAQPFKEAFVRSDIKKIYDFGYFETVDSYKEETSKDKMNLIFEVKEKPIISTIVFEGIV